jgi:hypothetical protein
LENKRVEQVLPRAGGEMAQKMYPRVSKCKNNKIFFFKFQKKKMNLAFFSWPSKQVIRDYFTDRLWLNMKNMLQNYPT